MKKLLLLLLLFGCNNKEPNKKQTVHLIGKEADYKLIKNSFSTEYLITSLETCSCISVRNVCFGGPEEYILENYGKLLPQLSDSSWYNLCSSNAVIMRYFAYKALYDRKSPLAEKARHLLENDKTVVCFYAENPEFNQPLNYVIKTSFK